MSTIEKMKDIEDFIFNFREYAIQNEEDYHAALIDYQLSNELIDKLNSLKELNLIDNSHFQITQFAFDYLSQYIIKNNIHLQAKIIEYCEENQKY